MNNTFFRALLAAAAAGALFSQTSAAQELAAVQVGEVYYAADKDEMTDADRSVVFSQVRTDPFRTANLQWVCVDGDVKVVYEFDKFFQGNAAGAVEVQVRFEGAEAQPPLAWPLIDGHQSALLPDDAMVPFTEAALQAASVIVRVTDVDGEQLTDRFAMGGLAEALGRLTCINVT